MSKEAMKPVYCLAIAYESGAIYIDNTIKSEVDLSALISQSDKARIVRVKVEEHTKRSLPASALFHIWAQQLSGFTGNDVLTQKAEFKIKFGYPILRANSEVWERLQMLFNGVGWWGLEYEEKIKYSELIPCTSIMSTKELNKMMKDIKNWAMAQFNIELSNGDGR